MIIEIEEIDSDTIDEDRWDYNADCHYTDVVGYVYMYEMIVKFETYTYNDPEDKEEECRDIAFGKFHEHFNHSDFEDLYIQDITDEGFKATCTISE